MVRRIVAVYLLLLLLLGLSVALSTAGLGAPAIPVHLALAGMMALLIYWHFMHLQESSGLVRAFALGAAVWLVLLFVFTASDYLTRISHRCSTATAQWQALEPSRDEHR